MFNYILSSAKLGPSLLIRVQSCVVTFKQLPVPGDAETFIFQLSWPTYMY